jgi:hypothetical protein
MSWKIWIDAEPEEEERLIQKAADFIEYHDMDLVALLILNTIKPLVYVGGELSRFFIAPILPFLDHKADAFIQTFEQRKNIEKLISKIEETEKHRETLQSVKKSDQS